MFFCINKEYFILNVLMIFLGEICFVCKEKYYYFIVFGINNIRKENKVIYLICF